VLLIRLASDQSRGGRRPEEGEAEEEEKLRNARRNREMVLFIS